MTSSFFAPMTRPEGAIPTKGHLTPNPGSRCSFGGNQAHRREPSRRRDISPQTLGADVPLEGIKRTGGSHPDEGTSHPEPWEQMFLWRESSGPEGAIPTKGHLTPNPGSRCSFGGNQADRREPSRRRDICSLPYFCSIVANVGETRRPLETSIARARSESLR